MQALGDFCIGCSPNVPDGQRLGAEDPSSQKVPAGQLSRLAQPDAQEKPAGQGRQCSLLAAPSSALAVPAGQGSGSATAGPQKCPLGQRCGWPAPAGQKDPAGHSWQAEALPDPAPKKTKLALIT